MAVPASQRAVADFLAKLAGAPPHETHISLVFVGDDTVWKLKKSVRLSFLDFTATAQRRHFCERELALNAASAPGLYRDVVPVVRGADGALGFGKDGDDPVDWVLRMARVPPDDFLDAIAAAGHFDMAMQDQVADAVAAYHQALPSRPIADPVSAMRAVLAGNLRAAHAAGLDPDRVTAWEQAAGPALDALGPELARRAQTKIRRCHGDLHLGNLCLWRGRPVPFDALEFDEALATIDVSYDLAFLLMDLDQRVGRAAANRVLNRYDALTGFLCAQAVPVFLSMRAFIRAHVAATRGAADEAAEYLGAAEAYLAPSPARIVCIGGLPGTGKSTLARALAPGLGRAPGALILRSDEIRKRQHGVAPEMRLGPEAYSEAASERVFAELARRAGDTARAGQAVIADATFIDPAHRTALATAAAAAGVPFTGLWLDAPLEALAARVAARRNDASDATEAVLRRAATAPTATAGDWVAINATDRAKALAEAFSALDYTVLE